jgi:ELWxxDGT repeat protein
MDGKGYFLAEDGVHGYELWKTDGTEAGTVTITDLPGDVSSTCRHVDGFIYFTGMADDLFSLYRSDGTVEGTVVVDNIDPSGHVHEIWSQDGITYLSWETAGGLGSIYNLGRVSGSGIEWIELRDVALGVTDMASAVTHPYTVANTTYFCGRDTGGLWRVNTAFHFLQTPYPQWRLVGDPLTLTVECAGGVGELSYQWIKDGVEIDGATDPTYHVDSVIQDDEGSYTCRVTDATKTIYETEPALIEVFEEGEMPAAGPLTLILMAAACAIGAARTILRKN